MVNKEIFIFENTDQMANFVIEKWVEISEIAIKGKGCFTVALSGGKTPVHIYKKLSDQNNVSWDKTHVFMVDERFVPINSDENNYHMIKQTLLRILEIPAKNIHPILTSEISPQSSAIRYEEDLISCFKLIKNEFPRFDLILLGIGEDGHTASLFPGTQSLHETRHLALAVSPPDKAKKERITLTFPVINNAANIMFLASGSNKAKIIKEVIEEKNSLVPAAMVKPQKGKIFFLLDESAGSLLSRNE